ncbi:MAG: FAD-dependent oxidoreductase [Dehalococcoidia bacterium]|nr:FAD-dependent oxidoreductase [Dehalococcoidia bacterium]
MFPKLFEPIQIGSMKLKNRLILSGINVNYAAEDGTVTKRLKDFYVERAKGGVGMVQTGICYVDPLGRFFTNMMGIHNDSVIPGLREMAQEVQSYGAAFVVQLCHVGRYASSKVTGAQPVAPSAVASRVSHEMPRELTVPEIKGIIEAFAQGARRARDAGADAVDLAGAVGYLIAQFLSPYSNKRNDEYGGDMERRMQFVLEIMDRIQQTVGKDYPIMIRISGDEFLPGGNTLEDMKVVAQALETAGIASINVIPGWHESPVPLVSWHVAPAQYAYLAEEVKKVVKVPVIASNRINTPELAERLIAEGRVDMVTMARALIADPEMPRKALEGRVDEIRPCVACNQGCYDRLFANLDISCMSNPAAGREDEFAIRPAPNPRKVMVVGGGPAGMEAARVAASRGHPVTLYEKSGALGGQLALAAVPTGKGEINSLVSYYSNQMARLGVKVNLGQEATAETVGREKPEAVIVAAGASPIIPNMAGVNGQNVVTALDVLAGKAGAGERVVIVGGGQVGVETADFLAEQGKKVTILEMLDKIGPDLGVTVRWIVMKRIAEKGIKSFSGARVQEITSKGVTYEKDGASRFLEADTVVLAVGARAEKKLTQELEGKVEVYAVGDCVQARKALDAIYEGAKAGLSV